MKQFDSIEKAHRDYADKQAEKVEIEKPAHVEKYDDKQKRQVGRSRRAHDRANES